MSLLAGPERHDIGTAPFVELLERPIDGSGKLAGDPRLKRDFMLGIFRHDEHQFTSDFNFRRCSPEITLTHAYSPDSAIRQEECDSFVIAGMLTQISVRATTYRLGAKVIEVPAFAPFSVALVT